MPLKAILRHLQGVNKLSSNPNKAQNSLNFITLSNLSEDQKIEIIQTGFQLQAEGKISLKNIMRVKIQIVYINGKAIVSNMKAYEEQSFINNANSDRSNS